MLSLRGLARTIPTVHPFTQPPLERKVSLRSSRTRPGSSDGFSAVIGAVIGEFVASDDGLGYLVLVSTSQSRAPLAFAALVLLTVISIALYYGIEFIKRIAVPWAPKN